LLDAYRHAVNHRGLTADAGQLAVVERLEELQRELCNRPEGLANWIRRSIGKPQPAPRGLYIWGGVGRGKTFLMDLFFQSLRSPDKTRIHFHRMMSKVHESLTHFRGESDPLEKVADKIAKSSKVLCFDEFFVSDIGDAMILGRLLEELFARGIVLITTSNCHPTTLYKDGLQRQRFQPAIDAIMENMQVVELGGDTDYRLRLMENAGTYLVPAGPDADTSLQQYFAEIAAHFPESTEPLSINHRDIPVRRRSRGIVWFDLGAICDGPRSQEDYIEIARYYPTVIISGVPVFSDQDSDVARRFIALVDEFYDRRVKLLLSADADAENLYQGKKLQFEFNRTASRLAEMQLSDYLHAEHIA